MAENYSAFSRFRFFPSDSREVPSLSIWNSETDSIQRVSCKNFNDYGSVKRLLQTISLEIKKSTSSLDNGCKDWHDQGWYRSADYYIASRATDNKILPSWARSPTNLVQSSIHEKNLLSEEELSKPFGFFKICCAEEQKGSLKKSLSANHYFFMGSKIATYYR